MLHRLMAREYKLLLDPARFQGKVSRNTANSFWNDQLKPVIDHRLDRRNGDRSRAERQFDPAEERIVRFWDTPDCTLSMADLAFRQRVTVKDEHETAERAQLTLKLRMPDFFVVASTRLTGSSDKAETKFEEDIAPLEIDIPDTGHSAVLLPARRSIRSRFSLSTRQTVDWDQSSHSLGNLQSRFPTLGDVIAGSNQSFDPDVVLIGGPIIREFVFEGARIRLSETITGVFSLTLWFFEAHDTRPDVAEISFKCAIEDGTMPGRAARRALALFIGLQTDLEAWVETRHSSKTSLALPGPCA
ncbi:hypothetical protein HFC70_07115 [Agrobacterium sp. a22-2]|uniref:hypothetical protein n=1 Tax=Agrobacterium sp. a22-2 TaxID=2283840 RepID=UPI001447E4C5|nr:hypothetical protein [Agrobacterium sp. a22-2]NKN36126.1 hypothetical protein [Agrobacterium sp. a22-2]